MRNKESVMWVISTGATGYKFDHVTHTVTKGFSGRCSNFIVFSTAKKARAAMKTLNIRGFILKRYSPNESIVWINKAKGLKRV